MKEIQFSSNVQAMLTSVRIAGLVTIVLITAERYVIVTTEVLAVNKTIIAERMVSKSSCKKYYAVCR